jgi:enterochelin esterase-like enzyme
MPNTLLSLRLRKLVRDYKRKGSSALDAFWEEMRDAIPLIERDPESAQRRLVTFLWRGDGETRRVGMYGGRPHGTFPKPLAQLAGSTVWFRTESLPRDTRLLYQYFVNAPELPDGDAAAAERWFKRHKGQRDPLNKKGFGPGSILDLPMTPKLPWSEGTQPRNPLTSANFKSKILGQNRALSVYTPPGYATSTKPCRIVVFLDGGDYEGFLNAPQALDHLTGLGAIAPTVGVFVHQSKRRNQELAFDDRFVDYLAHEVVPWVRTHYRTSTAARHTVIAGLSLGGLTAAYSAFRYPGIFGNVLSQSGSFMFFPGALKLGPKLFGSDIDTGALIRQYAHAPRKPIRFYLEAGRFEYDLEMSLVIENRRMRDVLEAKGYNVTYREFNGGHDFVGWQVNLPGALRELLA